MASPLLLLAVWNGPQLTSQERELWKAIEPSVAVLFDGERPIGSAALIDKRGYFIAHRLAMTGRSVSARIAGGERFRLDFRAMDEPSQLILLVANAWVPGPTNLPASTRKSVEQGEKLFAVLPTGPIRAEASTQSLGIMNPSRRMMPLNEIKFEASESSVGGALVFTQSGRFVGVLGATLASQETADQAPASKMLRGGGGFGGAAGAVQFGPSSLTVGYALSAAILDRVIDGFRSPDHQVDHPVIGVLCRDAQGTGAVIERLVEGSPAQLAGLRPGDVIVEMGGEAVRNQVDFAKIMLEQRVGSNLSVKVRRGSAFLISQVRVGRA